MLMTDDVTLDPPFDLAPPSEEQLRQLAAELDDEERRVLLEHGTEAPFCGIFLEEKREGVFTCRLCGLPLFSGGTKFESGTGWPNFTSRLPKITSVPFGIQATAWSVPRSSAPA